MQLFDPSLMKLLTFLTRRQAWLAPNEISQHFRVDGSPVTSRTVHRWFRFLRENGAFVYYPYPRANVFGLQDVLVRIHGLRNPELLAVLPFGASLNVEIGLADDQPFVSQGYWVPGTAMEEFKEFWRAARDLDLVHDVEIFQSRNTHFVYSPFPEVTNPDGTAVVRGPVDNRYFEVMLRKRMREPFEVRLGARIAESPLLIPIVVEHIWTHYSSRQVWEAIRSKGPAAIKAYAHGRFGRKLENPWAAMRYLQRQWSDLLRHFDEIFLQPRVLFNWSGLKNSMYASFQLRPGSSDRLVEAAIRISEKSIYTSVKPGVGYEETCLISCLSPNDQMLPLLQIVREFHHGREPPVAAIQDLKATWELFQPSFCRVDWRLFDPGTLTWQFDGDTYLERLKGMRADTA